MTTATLPQTETTTPHGVSHIEPNYNPVTITGRVEWLSQPYDSGWVRGTLRASREELKKLGINGGSQSINFNGVLANTVKHGCDVTLYGKRQDHDKYGVQFKAECVKGPFDDDISQEGLISFIADHSKIKGFGTVKARRLVAKHGIDQLDEELENSGGLAKEFGVKESTIFALRDVLLENKTFLPQITWLRSIGITQLQTERIVKKYGWKTRTFLEANPYQLIDDLRGYGFTSADALAKKIGIPEDSPQRLRAGILYVMAKIFESGHTYIEYDGVEGLLETANATLAMNALNSKELIAHQIEEMIADGDLVKVGKDGTQRISTPGIKENEGYIFRKLSVLWNESNPHKIKYFEDMQLTEAQRQAVRNAVEKQISVISGAAGTGKTFVLQWISEAYVNADKLVALAAPTGKAAQRITESTGFGAMTLHRLLGYNGLDWEFNEHNKLECDLVVIDECSMVDAALMRRLFEAIDWNRTSIVLLGDHNQLAPVGAGYPFRDIINGNLAPATVLTQIMRQGGILKENCSAILAGTIANTPNKSEATAIDAQGNLPWYLFTGYKSRTFQEAMSLREFLLRNVLAHISESFGFDLLREVQVLTPQNDGVIGVRELNIEIQKIVHRKLFDRELSEAEQGEFLVGDKVMQLKNDYKNDLSNGQIGYVTKVEKSAIFVEFQYGDSPYEVRLTPAMQRNIQHAYACTIHKYQGSQIACAIVLCHRTHARLLSRNLIYTAATRSTRCTMILGDRKGIHLAMENRDVERRRTLLGLVASREATS